MNSSGLKKKFSDLAAKDKRKLIDKNINISLTRQSELLGVSRSSLYYEPVISQEDIFLMRALDEIYTKCPFYGTRRMRDEFKKRHGSLVGRRRIRRLMKTMGLETLFPRKKPYLSAPNEENQIFPYLLRNLKIDHPNQVWATDITYIRLESGFCYLVVIMDWYSRYVIAWRLSDSLEMSFCLEALKEALKTALPEIFNSDRGSQFTAKDFAAELLAKDILVSHDGRGRYLDNIFVERLWRTVKYEDVYLKHYQTIKEVFKGLSSYLNFYNYERGHQSFSYQTPAEVYFQKKVEHARIKKTKSSEIYLKKGALIV